MNDSINYEEIYSSLERCKNIIYVNNFEEFINTLNETINENYTKEQCYIDILKTSVLNWRNLINFVRYMLQTKNEDDIEILVKNFNLIPADNLANILEEFDLKELLKECLKKGIINYYNSDIIDILLLDEEGKQLVLQKYEDFFYNGYDFRLLKILMEKAEIPEEKIIDSKSKILKNAYGDNLQAFIKWFKEKGISTDDDISLEDFIKQTYNDIEDITTLKMLEFFYKRFMEKQGLKISDIELIGKGEYSKSYKIGGFVLKFGEERKNKTIPYHRRILQPLVRQETNPNNKNNFYIEIQNAVDNKWYDGMTEEEIQEELYKIYKEMRNKGIVWTDIKKENVGRLIKPNKTNYTTEVLKGNIYNEKSLKVIEEELKVSDNSVGIINRIDEPCLMPGELVILDTDLIFRLEDIDIEADMKDRFQPRYIRYEQRYLYELAQAKGER